MSEAGRVLVLDDEATVCARLRDHLAGKGFAVETFTDSAAALVRLDAAPFDVVVTDLKMPGPSGLEVLRAVREKELPTEVIVITGYGSIEACREAEYADVLEFVAKPFRMTDLEKLVARGVRKARRRKVRS